jgi:anti-sigma-K factor RskA
VAIGAIGFLALLLAALGTIRAVSREEPAPDQQIVKSAVGASGAELRASYRLGQFLVEVNVFGLPAPPPGRMYQLWLIPDDEIPRNLGLLLIHPDGVARAQPDIALSRGHMLTVTEEPAGGSPQPTGMPLVALSI